MDDDEIRLPIFDSCIKAEPARIREFRPGMLVAPVRYFMKGNQRVAYTASCTVYRLTRPEEREVDKRFTYPIWVPRTEIGLVLGVDKDYAESYGVYVLFPSALGWVKRKELWIIPESLYRNIS